jgi:hypothetical protein
LRAPAFEERQRSMTHMPDECICYSTCRAMRWHLTWIAAQVAIVDGCMETFCSLMICLSLVSFIANVLAMPRLCGAWGFDNVDGVLPSSLRLGRCSEHCAIGRHQGGFHQHLQGLTVLHRMDLASLLVGERARSSQTLATRR